MSSRNTSYTQQTRRARRAAERRQRRLARQALTAQYSISLPTWFPLINVYDRDVALRVAKHDSEPPSRDPAGRVVLYTDGSFVFPRGAAAVVWKAYDPVSDATYWSGDTWAIMPCANSEFAEAKALLEAIRVAADIVSVNSLNVDVQAAVNHIVICTDCLWLMNKFKELQQSAWSISRHDNLLKVDQLLPLLQTIRISEALLELRWTPSHSGVAGNEEADRRSVAARVFGLR